MKNVLLFLPFTILFFAILGCDPAVELTPRDWQRLDGGTYINRYEGFDIVVGRIGDLIGMETVYAHGCIYNRGKSLAKFEVGTATLRAAEKEYHGIQNLLHENAIKLIPPDSCQPFDIKFELHKSLEKALIEPVLLDMTVKKGTESIDISIPMTNAFREDSNS